MATMRIRIAVTWLILIVVLCPASASRQFIIRGTPGPGLVTNPVPADLSTGISFTGLTVMWTPSSNTTTMDVVLDTNPTPTTARCTAIVFPTASCLIGNLLGDTQYYWQVTAHGPGGTTPGPIWTFHTLVSPPPTPSTPSPVDGQQNVGVTGTTLSCTVSNTTSVDIKLDTINPPVSFAARGLPGCALPLGTLQSGTTYYWQAIAHNSGGQTVGPSGATGWSFTTTQPVGVPTNYSPIDGSTGISTQPTLTWTAANATSYDVRTCVGVGCTPSVVSAGQSGASYFPPVPYGNLQTIGWQIKAYNASSNATGLVAYFQTQAAGTHTTRTTDGCLAVEIQDTIGLSQDGDTVIIHCRASGVVNGRPACPSPCKWLGTYPQSVNADNVKLDRNIQIIGENFSTSDNSIVGATATAPVLIDDLNKDSGPNSDLFYVTASGGSLSQVGWRISNLEIQGYVRTNNGCGTVQNPTPCTDCPGMSGPTCLCNDNIFLYCDGNNTGHITAYTFSHGFRVDHITCTNPEGVCAYFDNDGWGVLDHWRVTKTYKNTFIIRHGAWNGIGAYGDNSWASADTMGMAGGGRTIVIEDSTLTELVVPVGAFISDCFAGGRFVVRDNTIINDGVQTHGTETSGRIRGCRQLEVYDNVFQGTGGGAGIQECCRFRAGTGVMTNNDARQANFLKAGVFEFLRSTIAYPIWGRCDGSGTFDENLAGTPGYAICEKDTGSQDNCIVPIGTTCPGPCNSPATTYRQFAHAGRRCIDAAGVGMQTKPFIDNSDPPRFVGGAMSGWTGQNTEPWYIWCNHVPDGSNPTYPAAPNALSVFSDSDQPYGQHELQGIDYFNDTTPTNCSAIGAKPGWTRYQYPHPLNHLDHP